MGGWVDGPVGMIEGMIDGLSRWRGGGGGGSKRRQRTQSKSPRVATRESAVAVSEGAYIHVGLSATTRRSPPQTTPLPPMADKQHGTVVATGRGAATEGWRWFKQVEGRRRRRSRMPDRRHAGMV